MNAIFFSCIVFVTVFSAIEASEIGEEVCKTRLIDLSSLVASGEKVELKNVRNVIVTTQLTGYLQKNLQALAFKYNFFIDSSAKTYELKGWNYLRDSDDEDSDYPVEFRKNTIHIALAADPLFPTPVMFATLRRILMCGKLRGHLHESFRIIGTGKHKCDNSVALNFWKLMNKYHIHTEGPIPAFKCVLNLSLNPVDNEF